MNFFGGMGVPLFCSPFSFLLSKHIITDNILYRAPCDGSQGSSGASFFHAFI